MESVSVSKQYCESLDRFVSIKKCSPEDITYLIRDIPDAIGKKTYSELVVAYCVVGYFSDISPVFDLDNPLFAIADIIKSDLYSMCVTVNPGLDIKKVHIASTLESQIPLIGVAFQEYGINVANLELELAKQIIGQNDAIMTVADCIRRAVVGLKDPKKPIGTFGFVGSTGVGKTELAKALVRCLFNGDEKYLVRVDCSEYAMSHEYAKLIGAPPGYIGHNDGGQLGEAMKQKTGVVLLFDEIEKAHRKVHNLLLQILDEGRITDTKGGVLDFTKSVVVMTSNVGVEAISSLNNAIGFSKNKITHQTTKRATVKDFEKQFPPEFINRIDEIVVFKDLSFQDKCEIANKMLGELQDRALRIGIDIECSNAVAELMVRYDLEASEKYGARPIRRAIQALIETPLSRKIARNELSTGKLQIYVRNKKIKFSEAA